MTEAIRSWLQWQLGANAFARHCGMVARVLEEDRAVMEIQAESHHLNAGSRVQGGVMFSLADCAAGTACRTDGRQYVTQSSAFNFLRPGAEGDTLRAEAVVRKRGKSTCYVEVEVTAGERTLATGTFQFFCLGPGCPQAEGETKE